MFDPEDKKPKEVKDFPRGTVRINELMKAMMKAIQEVPVIFQNLFEVRFVTTKLDEESIIVLCYKKPLHQDWLAAAENLASQIGKVKIIGHARKQLQITKHNNPSGDEYIKEQLMIKGQPFYYLQTEGAFTQPNAYVCEKMITWALDMTSDSQDSDLLELYCGGGTFTAPFSKNFRKVLATEISKSSVNLARKCFELNQIENIAVVRLSSEEFTEFFLGKKDFSSRMAHLPKPIDIRDYNIQTVFVDPPRAGLDPATCALISRFQKIVYVSCNPVTLARDVEALRATHEVTRVAAFDQFPYTEHLESGVVLVRRPDAPAVSETVQEPSRKRGAEDEEGDDQDDQQEEAEEAGDSENIAKKQKIDH
jgi:tRNA (uracil-5-)-methyltransferase